MQQHTQTPECSECRFWNAGSGNAGTQARNAERVLRPTKITTVTAFTTRGASNIKDSSNATSVRVLDCQHFASSKFAPSPDVRIFTCPGEYAHETWRPALLVCGKSWPMANPMANGQLQLGERWRAGSASGQVEAGWNGHLLATQRLTARVQDARPRHTSIMWLGTQTRQLHATPGACTKSIA